MNKDNTRQSYTYNITFVMSPHVEETFLTWLGDTRGFSTLGSNPDSTGYRIQKVVEIGGEKPGPDHGLSIALQVDFRSKGQADGWGETTLPRLLGGFMNEFGPGAAYFTTLLETTAFK